MVMFNKKGRAQNRRGLVAGNGQRPITYISPGIQPRTVTIERYSGPIYNVGAAGSGNVAGALDFNLGSIFSSDIQAAWAEYRINWVEVTVAASWDAGGTAGASAINSVGTLYLAEDPTATVSGTPTLGQMTKFASCKARLLPSGTSLTYKFTPRPILTMDDNGVADPSGTPSGANPWLNTNTGTGISVPHKRLLYYGAWIPPAGAIPVQGLVILPKFNISLRSIF